MAELVSDYVKYAKKRGDCIEKVVEIYDSADGGQTHGPKKAKGGKKNVQNEDKGSRCYRVTAVCVLLLCVLLLSAVTFLWIKFNNVTKESDQLQTSYNNLYTETDQLQTSYNNMQNKMNQLQFQKDSLQLHKDQLQKVASGLESTLLKLGWRIFNSSIYAITTEKMSWTKSKSYCIDRGAELTIINSREEQEFISKNFSNTEAWIGLTDTEKEGFFVWVDGTALSTEFWWNGEPNDYQNNEDCVITGYQKAYTSNMTTWADYPCNHLVLGICEREIFN